MSRTKITRICPGEYEISHGEFVASISRNDYLASDYGQWVVSANWDRMLYSDPIYYLADAKKCAKEMIDQAIMDELRRVTRDNKRRMEELGLAS